MSALTTPVQRKPYAEPRPLPWRRMTWVTWRQHRGALCAAGGLLAALGAYLGIVGVQLHHAYTAATACHPGALACRTMVNHFNGIDTLLANGVVLQAVPPLIGAFVGAPLLARELETGTFRFTWTQGFGRWRWTLAKLVLLALALAVAAGAFSVLLSWYYQPYFPTRNFNLGLTEASPLAPGLFDLRGLAFPAWTLAAFAIGALAGMLIRRVVPAIVAALAAYTGLALLTGLYLRQHYLTPLVTSKLTVPGSALIIRQPWLTRTGHLASPATLNHILQNGPPGLAGKGGIPQALSVWRYLERHGYTRMTSYQPGGRFWTFQWIESGWLLGLAVLLIAATVWLVRRRAA